MSIYIILNNNLIDESFSKIKNLFKKFKNKNFFYLWMKFSKYINGCEKVKLNFWNFEFFYISIYKNFHNKSWKKINKIKIFINVFEL